MGFMFWGNAKPGASGLQKCWFWERQNAKSMFARDLIFENRKPGNGILRKLDLQETRFWGKAENMKIVFAGIRMNHFAHAK